MPEDEPKGPLPDRKDLAKRELEALRVKREQAEAERQRIRAEALQQALEAQDAETFSAALEILVDHIASLPDETILALQHQVDLFMQLGEMGFSPAVKALAGRMETIQQKQRQEARVRQLLDSKGQPRPAAKLRPPVTSPEPEPAEPPKTVFQKIASWFGKK